LDRKHYHSKLHITIFKLQVLAANSATFNATPTNLLTLRTSWLEAYKAYQYVAIYSFGKSEKYLKESANTYQQMEAGIDSNISAGGCNLTLLSQFDKQGFPALDYLINGLNYKYFDHFIL
jgi:hypothetical protein